MSYQEYYENKSNPQTPVKNVEQGIGFHFHKYGRWEKQWKDSIFQNRYCVKCGKIKQRHAF